MSNEGLASTARLTAAGRAIEGQRPDRLFFDPLAEALAGDEGFALLDRWRLPGAPRENPTIGPRTKFYDDIVVASVGRGIRQLVFVAAGMDTRAFRLNLPGDVVAFELDQPTVLSIKQQILDEQHAQASCARVVVPVDLADSTWAETLVARGFDPHKPATFVVEGLAWYLTKQQNDVLLDTISGIAVPGSQLAIDLISQDHLESPTAKPFFELTATLGALWQFGTNDPSGFLRAHGWTAQVTSLDALSREVRRATTDDATQTKESGTDNRAPLQGNVLLH
jgi:methyltransferase (TIGR00027 family)